MAGEFKHKTVGTELTQAEWEAVGGHVFDSQATGDVAYASSATQISRLAKGTEGDSLVMGGSNIPAWNTAVQSDVTGSRAIDGTVYQNTSGRPLIVTINVKVDVDDISSSGNSRVTIVCDSNATPTTTVMVLRLSTDGVGTDQTGIDAYLSGTLVVLPSYYYKATAAAANQTTPTIQDWFEWEI